MNDAVRIRLRPERPWGAAELHGYRVAGQLLCCDEEIAELAPFTRPLPAESAPPAPEAPPNAAAGTIAYRGRGRVGGRLVEVDCRVGESAYRLEVAGGVFHIALDGSAILSDGTAPPSDAWLALHALLGPCLALALAARGVLCLHAGAVLLAGRATALVGPSGAGKSTLTARLAATLERVERPPGAGSVAARLADDILPIAVDRSGAVCLPAFPQLGLPAVEQWPAAAPGSLPLAAIYRLSLVDSRRPLAVADMRRREATLELVRSTVAGRLFGPDLLRRQLDLCAELAARVPLRRLRYPRHQGLLPETLPTLEADLPG